MAPFARHLRRHRRCAAAALALLLATAGAAQAGEPQHFCGRSTPHPIDATLERDSERSGGVTVELRNASARAMQAWDRELNRVYRQLLKVAGTERADALRAAQRAWLAYDKAQGQWDWAQHADEGTSALLNTDGAAMSRLRQRVCDLSQDLQYLQDIQR